MFMKATPSYSGLLALLLLAVPAYAQSETPPEKSGRMEQRRQEMLKRYDKNGDGVLDAEEKAAMRAEMQQHRGTTGGAERGSRMHEEMLKRFDKDGDGQLNAEEQAEADKARQEARQKHEAARAKMHEETLKRYDKNGDGVLDDEEKAAMREDYKKRRNGGKTDPQ